MWKDFLYFTRSERRGILILIILILLVCFTPWLISLLNQPEKRTLNDEQFEKEYAKFIASLHEVKAKENRKSYNAHFAQRQILLQPFDPNTADSATFLSLGLPPWMAKNILRYRAKGGQFRKPEDFRKIYGLTEKQYANLLPYITIEENYEVQDTIRLFSKPEKSRDSLIYSKHPAGTVIELNRADTTELRKIPGIGSGIANMITNYRRQLGGFYRIEQLREIHLSVDKLHDWFTIDRSAIQKINLNKAGIGKLKAHPYINFYQAKVIVEHRRKRGILKSLDQLKLYEEFSEEDIERIQPYICFE